MTTHIEDEPTKTCTTCEEEKPYSLFYKEVRGLGGRRSKCKVCDNKRTKNWSQSLPKEKQKAYNLYSQYRMTLDQYNELLSSQNHCCSICGVHESESRKGLFVDHDHRCCPQSAKSCGECIRGLLCDQCNTGIGKFKDDAALLIRAAEYIEKYG